MILISNNPYKIYLKGVKFHSKKNLGKAINYYKKALQKEPPREPTEEERKVVLNYAPTLFVTPNEPFPLKDVVAIKHPSLSLIAYHLFWEDDIDYPLDQEPCDHEIVWVETNNQETEIENMYTYFHGKVIKHKWSENLNYDNHPVIQVQWGKHGSLLPDWENWRDGEILQYMKKTYLRLKNEGALNKDTPLAKRWVNYFTGNLEDFTNFSQKIETTEYLKEKDMMSVGTYGNAILKWHFLHYNFNPKYSWPDLHSPGKGIW